MTVTEQERADLNQAALTVGAVLCVVGLVCLIVLAGLPLGGEVQFTFFLVGAGFVAMGIVFIAKGGAFGEEYVLKKRLETYDAARQDQANEAIRSLKEDDRGIVWVWIVAIVTWAIMAVAYFSLSMVLYMVLDDIEAFAPWTGHAWETQYLGVIELTRNVTAWFLIIMTVGIIGWALINSARRVGDTWPY